MKTFKNLSCLENRRKPGDERSGNLEMKEIETIREILAALIKLKQSANTHTRRHAAGLIAAYHAEIDELEIVIPAFHR